LSLTCIANRIAHIHRRLHLDRNKGRGDFRGALDCFHQKCCKGKALKPSHPDKEEKLKEKTFEEGLRTRLEDLTMDSLGTSSLLVRP
jgi:hypothetical protein